MHDAMNNASSHKVNFKPISHESIIYGHIK
jgi:hypothetical protein